MTKMEEYVVYNADGVVLRGFSCPQGLSSGFVSEGENLMRVDERYQGELAYVSGGAYIRVPPAPSAAHVFNWTSKVWEDPRLLMDFKGLAWARIKACRDAAEFSTFSWSGHIFDGDIDAQRRINLAVLGAQVALAAGQPWSVDWTLADNSFVTLSASDMVGVAEAMGASINAAHEWARGLRIQIDAASTIEELEAVWPVSS